MFKILIMQKICLISCFKHHNFKCENIYIIVFCMFFFFFLDKTDDI